MLRCGYQWEIPSGSSTALYNRNFHECSCFRQLTMTSSCCTVDWPVSRLLLLTALKTAYFSGSTLWRQRACQQHHNCWIVHHTWHNSVLLLTTIIFITLQQHVRSVMTHTNTGHKPHKTLIPVLLKFFFYLSCVTRLCSSWLVTDILSIMLEARSVLANSQWENCWVSTVYQWSGRGVDSRLFIYWIRVEQSLTDHLPPSQYWNTIPSLLRHCSALGPSSSINLTSNISIDHSYPYHPHNMDLIFLVTKCPRNN